MDSTIPTASRRLGPGRREEAVSAGLAPAASLRAALRGMLIVAGVIGAAFLVGPREPASSASNIIGQHTGVVLATVMSPDGRRLASSGFDGSIRIWDVAGRGPAVVLEPGAGPIHGLAWSPDGSSLAAAGGWPTVTVWDAQTWERVADLEVPPGRPRGLAWSPDGATVAAGGLNSTVAVWDVASRRLRTVLRGHQGNVNLIRFSEDGRTLITAGSDGLVGTWDMAAGKLIRLYQAGPLTLSGLACTPSGDVFATSNVGPGVFWCRWGQADGTGTGTGTALEGGGPYVALAASPDGRFLAASTTGGDIDLWQFSPRRRLATWRGHSGPVRTMTFTADGLSLFSGGSDGTIRTWHAIDEETGATRCTPVAAAAITPAPRAPENSSGKSDPSGQDDQDGTLKLCDARRR